MCFCFTTRDHFKEYESIIDCQSDGESILCVRIGYIKFLQYMGKFLRIVISPYVCPYIEKYWWHIEIHLHLLANSHKTWYLPLLPLYKPMLLGSSQLSPLISCSPLFNKHMNQIHYSKRLLGSLFSTKARAHSGWMMPDHRPISCAGIVFDSDSFTLPSEKLGARRIWGWRVVVSKNTHKHLII